MANLSPTPIQQFFMNNGKPADGYLLFTYVAGTSTKVATYIDSTGVTPNTNPIVLNYRGECRIWIDPALSYKFVLAPKGDTDPPTSPIWTVDDITASPPILENTAVDTGTVNNISLSIPRISSPVAFTRIIFKALNTNTGATTISINGGTAKNLTWQSRVGLSGGEVQANGIYEAIYDGAQWQLQGPTLQPGDVRMYGAVGDGVTNDTAAFVAAIAAGRDVYVPPGTFLVDGGQITMTVSGQMIAGAGRTRTTIKKRTSGNLVTISAGNVTIQDISINNDDAGVLAGYIFFSTGFLAGIKLVRVDSVRCATSTVRFEGGRSGGTAAGHWTIQSCRFDNASAPALTPVIHWGKDEPGFYSMLYGAIFDCQLQPATHPVRTDCCSGVHIALSQIGGWDNNVLTGLNTVNTCTECRVLGAVSIEGANHQFSNNNLGAHTVTFEAGSSGCFYIGPRDSGSNIVNNGLTSNVILDQFTGEPAFAGNFRVNNNQSIRLYNAAGTNFAQLNMSAANNLSLANFVGATQVSASGTNRVQLFNNSAATQTSVCGGGQLLIARLAADPVTDVENGQIYYNTATDKFRGRAAGAWVDLH